MAKCTIKERDPLRRYKEIMKGDRPNYKRKSTNKKTSSVKIKRKSKVIKTQPRTINNKKRRNKKS